MEPLQYFHVRDDIALCGHFDCFTITVLADKHNKRSCSKPIFLLNASQSSCSNSPLSVPLIILLGHIGDNWVVPLF